MQIKRDFKTKSIILCILALTLLIGVAVNNIQLSNYIDAANSPLGKLMNANFLGALLVFASLFIAFLVIFVEPIHNTNFNNIIKDITIEDITKYKADRVDDAKIEVKKVTSNCPRLFLPNELVNDYIQKSIPCIAYCTEDALILQFSDLPKANISSEFDYVIPFDNIVAVEGLNEKLLYQRQIMISLTLSNGNKMILAFQAKSLINPQTLYTHLRTIVKNKDLEQEN